MRRYVNARELSDPKAIEALFTADADQHTTSGEWRRGRAQVVPGTIESSTRNPGNRSITIAAVRFITPDVAIADGPYEIAGGGTVRRMWTTLVLAREAGVWRIAADSQHGPDRRRGPASAMKGLGTGFLLATLQVNSADSVTRAAAS